MEFALPEENAAFRYFGHGPMESYCDLHAHAPVGLYDSNAKAEYVHYVRPQEHGNHYGVRLLQFGNLTVRSGQDFECKLSQFSPTVLTNAAHTDELVSDGNTYVRIDYKVSGIGSGSCGPAVAEQYRLSENRFTFRFTLSPR